MVKSRSDLADERVDRLVGDDFGVREMSKDPQQRDTPDRGAPGVSRRHSLQWKAVLSAVALVALSTGLCGLLCARVAEQALRESLHRDAYMLSDTVARAMASRASAPGGGLSARFTERLTLDERVAFVVLSDAEGETIDRRIASPGAWSDYERLVPPDRRLSPLRVNQTMDIARGDGPPLTLVTRPIWVGGEADPREARIAGYVGLGMVDASAGRLVKNVQLATLVVVMIACVVSIPLIVLATRWWTAPLRRMLTATMRLAHGNEPQPLKVRRRDEVGALARAFNVMAQRLSAARAELLTANEQLEAQVDQRTRQLRTANEKLQMQMRDKDEFIRAITHDLNAPVRNIAGMTRMLLKKYERELTEDALSKLNRIAANARAESELLGDLLELSRLRTQHGKRQRVDLEEMAASLRDSLSYDLEAQGIELCVEAPLPTLAGDRNRLRQLFQNLLDNAIKYMPADAPEKRITLGANREGGQTVFFVRDTGRGIAPKDHERVFQVFQRARYSGDQEAAGRGVGLASVKTIVEVYHGQIWLESEPGRGTTFLFTLPLAMDEPGEQHDDPATPDAACDPPAAGALATAGPAA